MKAVRVFAAFLSARAAFGLVYLTATLAHWPILFYYPLERRWAFEARPSGFAMAWFGTTALALVAAAVAGAGVWFVSANEAIGLALGKPGAVLAIARAGAMILVVDYVYFGWALMHQTPAPLAIPGWYCPR